MNMLHCPFTSIPVRSVNVYEVNTFIPKGNKNAKKK